MNGRAHGFRAAEILLPLVALAGYVIVRALAGADADLALRVIAPTVAQVLSAIGCALAARAFEPGAHLSRVWALFAVSGGAVALQYVLGLVPRSPPLDWLRLLVTLTVNLSSVWGLWLLARTISVAGLAPPGRRFGRRFAYAVAFLVAVAVAGPGLVVYAQDFLAAPSPAAARPVIGGAVDIVSMTLIAPIGLTAVALRGGILFRPWTLLALTSACFLLLNVAGIAARLALPETQRALQVWLFDPIVLLAPLLYFGAAWAQFRVARGAEHEL